MKHFLFAVLACTSLAAQAADLTTSIIMQGNSQGATACVTCHGSDGGGISSNGFPRLAGLNGGYISNQLQNFKTGKRTNPIMQPIANALTAKEIKLVAAYYASLPMPAYTPEIGTPELIKSGEGIALNGDWNHDIPACFQCHGPGGRGINSDFPAIVGQSSAYISSQIEAWKTGARADDPIGLMRSVSSKLTPEQIKAVSTFIANQTLTNGIKK